MSFTAESEIQREERKKRTRRTRIAIVVCLLLFGFFTYLESEVFQLGEISFPVSGNVLVFALININAMLLLLMVFLTLRNIVQLVFERKRRILGTRLRTKLVISFVSLSLIPTGLLFFVALQFVSTSMDYWFNTNVEQSLVESLNVAKDVYQDAQDRVGRKGALLARRFENSGFVTGSMPEHGFVEAFRASQDLAEVRIISQKKELLGLAEEESLKRAGFPDLQADLIGRALEGESDLMAIQTVAGGELVRMIIPLRAQTDEVSAVIVVAEFVSGERLERMETVSKGLEGYRQLMMLKAPIKTSLLVMLLIVTLLIIFCAIWFGFYVANGLTGPIGRLAEATRRVADGELDFVLEKTSGDEMGTLVDSFNLMTRDLLVSREQLEDKSQELESRRRHMEIILQNVAAGVISMDAEGKVTMINRYAEDLLKLDRSKIEGRNYRSILRAMQRRILDEFLDELFSSGKQSIDRPLRLTVGEDVFSLRVNFTRLADEEGNHLGVVIVFDNLTELEKAQRMAAWREVARRIAHEVKNPLTPIQLSAQRLRKKYLERLRPEEDVFVLCTTTIINQVDELKRLVGEFSEYARMPAIHKTEGSLAEMARQLVAFYQSAHKHIDFHLEDRGVRPFYFDAKQFKRVLINLLDNAVAVLSDGGHIEIELREDAEHQLAVIEVRDTGPGVSDSDKPKLFEPYFSTKKSGTGLGLAIAATIVSDHGGTIRAKDNLPKGARFVVELPLSTEEEAAAVAERQTGAVRFG